MFAGHCGRDGLPIARPEIEDLLQVARILGQFAVVETEGIVLRAHDGALRVHRLMEECPRLCKGLIDDVPRYSVIDDLEESPIPAGAIECRQRVGAGDPVDVDDRYRFAWSLLNSSRHADFLGCSHLGNSV